MICSKTRMASKPISVVTKESVMVTSITCPFKASIQ
jgi:hypothetical protein